jgi:hypothetical protein
VFSVPLFIYLISFRFRKLTVPVELNDLTASGNVSFGIMDEVPNIRVVVDDFKWFTSGYELTGETAVTVIGNAVQLENLRLNTIAKGKLRVRSCLVPLRSTAGAKGKT